LTDSLDWLVGWLIDLFIYMSIY